MGIEGLGKWIRENHPSAVSRINLSNFAGRRIAIDGTNVCYEIWSSAFKEVVKRTNVLSNDVDRSDVMNICLDKLYHYLRRILSCDILPVFIFDGGSYHENKKIYAHVRRKSGRERAKERLESLEKEIAKLDLSIRNISYLETKKKLLCQTETPDQEMDAMKNTLFALGIPCFQAEYEAEKLCSQLCFEGKVDAVISSDSDNLPHGCLFLITRIRLTDEGEMADCISLLDLLESMNLSFQSFVDLCIMCGCDYNTNIPSIGINRAYKLIKECGSIENLPEYFNRIKLDTSYLDYETCRKIFSLNESENLSSEVNLNVSPMDKDLLKEYNVFWGDDIAELLEKLPKIETLSIKTQLP